MLKQMTSNRRVAITDILIAEAHSYFLLGESLTWIKALLKIYENYEIIRNDNWHFIFQKAAKRGQQLLFVVNTVTAMQLTN
jgi:hypothetical protein